MSADIGQEAPDFTLKDQDNNEVTLSSFRGDKSVALVFYPFTFTAVCEGELCALRDDLEAYAQAGMQVLAVSCDSRHAQKRWADEKGYGFPLLSDFWPHGEVSMAYGVFNDVLGCAIRATFIIDQSGTIVDRFQTDSLATPREKASYEAALSKV